MKKLCAGLLTALLLGLCACGESTESPVEDLTGTAANKPTTEIAVTTEEPTTLDPNRLPAIMEPVQGGLMLYTFTGKNGKLGLINQEGEVVAKPQYDRYNTSDVIDADGHMKGLAIGKGTEYFIYYFDGSIKKINETIQHIYVYRGGKYAEINPISRQLSDSGLYDLHAEKYVIPPKNGQMMQGMYDNVEDVLVINSIWEDNKQWWFDLKEGNLREVPRSMGQLRACYSGAGWCEIYNDARRYYDSDMKELSSLRDWIIVDSPQNAFRGTEYELIYNFLEAYNPMDGDTPETTKREFAFVDRNGKMIDRGKYKNASKHGNFFQVTREDDTVIWLDGKLNELGRAKTGERLIDVEGPGEVQALLLDANGNVIRVVDRNFKTQSNEGIYIGGYANPTLYRLKNAKWKIVDLNQYRPNMFENAFAKVVCEDYIVVCVTGQKDSMMANSSAATILNTSLSADQQPHVQPMLSIHFPTNVGEVFSVNWDGERIQSPITPFYYGVEFEHISDVLPEASWQGPNYYWVEKDGKRGYVNTKGEWLFVDQ